MVRRGSSPRYSAGHKAETRLRVLRAAAEAIRADGVHKLALGSVMAGAGLTHGAFYFYFSSRDHLLSETIEHMLAESAERLAASLKGRAPADGLADYIDFYLSTDHRDGRGRVCPIPVVATDAPRLSPVVRTRIAAAFTALETELAAVLGAMARPQAAAEAQSLFAEMVGTLLLARAQPDPSRSERLLAEGRAALKRRMGVAVSD